MKFKDGQPIYVQIAERLSDEIISGKYPPGGRVPGVREYSVMVEVNINTTVRAYDLLAIRGIISQRRGLGYFVTEDAQRLILYTRRREFFEGELPELQRRMILLDISLEEVVNALKNNKLGGCSVDAQDSASQL